MNREHIVLSAGIVFVTFLSLAAWTVGAARPKRVHEYPPFPDINDEIFQAMDEETRNQMSEQIHLRHMVFGHLSKPPGPRPDWLIGNLRQLPKGRWAETFTAWQKVYGDLIYMTALGRGILVVNSLDIAKEMTIKRSSVYSGRPPFVMIGDLMGWDWIITGMQPGPNHTEGRKILKQSLGASSLPQYDHILTTELTELLQAIRRSSTKSARQYSGHDIPPPSSKAAVEAFDPLHLITHTIASIIIRVAYGDGVFKDIGEQLISLNTETVRQLNWVAGQFWPVEYMPFLRYLPESTPGAQFKHVARTGFEMQNGVRYGGWTQAIDHFVRGTLGTCLAAEYMDESASNEKMGVVRDALGVMFGAGVDTTSFTTTIFLAAILSHPQVQSKIHTELDAFLHETSKAFPSPSDSAHLPYLQAALKESMRWMPTLALGVPRSSLREDVYKQWYIPKDTLVFLNAGFMCRDPKIWDEPDRFLPERWLESHNPSANQLPDVYDIVFGFGRRVCPGRQLAQRAGFFLVAGLLSMYEILPPEGQPVPLPDSFEYADNFARYPSNLLCRFRPRK